MTLMRGQAKSRTGLSLVIGSAAECHTGDQS